MQNGVWAPLNHYLLTDIPVANPLAQQAFADTAAVDIGGVKAIPTTLEEVVKHDGGVRHGHLVVHPHHQSGDWLTHAGNFAVAHIVVFADGERSLVYRKQHRLRFLNSVFQANRLTPAVERLHVAKRILPGHCRWRRLASVQVFGDGIGLNGEQTLRGIDEYLLRFALAPAVDNEPGRSSVPAGCLRCGDDNSTFRAENLQDVVLTDLHSCGYLCQDVTGKAKRTDGPPVHARFSQVGGAADHDWLGEILTRRYTGHQTGHRDAVTAYIENGAPPRGSPTFAAWKSSPSSLRARDSPFTLP